MNPGARTVVWRGRTGRYRIVRHGEGGTLHVEQRPFLTLAQKRRGGFLDWEPVKSPRTEVLVLTAALDEALTAGGRG